MDQNEPLQAALQALDVALRNLSPLLAAALQSDVPEPSGFVDPPLLRDDERLPETVPDEAIFEDPMFNDHPPRRLKAVWNGQGDYDDSQESLKK